MHCARGEPSTRSTRACWYALTHAPAYGPCLHASAYVKAVLQHGRCLYSKLETPTYRLPRAAMRTALGLEFIGQISAPPHLEKFSTGVATLRTQRFIVPWLLRIPV